MCQQRCPRNSQGSEQCYQGECHDTLKRNVIVCPDEGQRDERRIGEGTELARENDGAAVSDEGVRGFEESVAEGGEGGPKIVAPE